MSGDSGIADVVDTNTKGFSTSIGMIGPAEDLLSVVVCDFPTSDCFVDVEAIIVPFVRSEERAVACFSCI